MRTSSRQPEGLSCGISLVSCIGAGRSVCEINHNIVHSDNAIVDSTAVYSYSTPPPLRKVSGTLLALSRDICDGNTRDLLLNSGLCVACI